MRVLAALLCAALLAPPPASAALLARALTRVRALPAQARVAALPRGQLELPLPGLSRNFSGPRLAEALRLLREDGLRPVAFDGRKADPAQLELPFVAVDAEAARRRLPDLAGRRTLEDYREPLWAGRRIALARGGGRFLRGAARVAAFAGFGALGGAAAVAMARKMTVSAVWARRRSETANAPSRLPAAERASFLRRVNEIAAALGERLGLSPERVPPAILDNRHGTGNAWARRSEMKTGWGDSWAGRPERTLAAVMGHEFAHLFVDRDKPRWEGPVELLYGGMFGLAAGLVTWLAAHSPASASALWPLLGPSRPGFMLLASAAAAALWTAGVALEAAGLRLKEKRADHFGAWLTDPLWLAEFFAESGGSDSPFATHPLSSKRIRALQRQDRRQRANSSASASIP